MSPVESLMQVTLSLAFRMRAKSSGVTSKS